MAPRSIVIVGGGASAVYTAVALEERGASAEDGPPVVTVVANEPEVGRGLAYGRADPHHRLNSPAGKMSVSAADDAHFTDWLAARGEDVDPGDFVHRLVFGDYLVDVFAQLVADSDGRVTVVGGTAVDLVTDERGAHVTLEDGRTLDADAAVLAVGNPPPGVWDTGAALQIDDPWAPGALDAVPTGSRVLLVGTGLTTVDVATGLARRDPTLTMTATSRHLLLPGVHPATPAAPGPGLDPALVALGDLAHDLHVQVEGARATGQPWQGVVDGMRPRLMDHWLGFSLAERDRFVRHFARRWDVHRHRMAVAVHDELQGLVDTGRLAFVRRPDPAEHDVVVFCTGPSAVTAPGWSALTDALRDAGRIAPEPLGLGLDADATGEVRTVHGSVDGRLYAIGHALRGALWETTAIGEIRILANRIAGELVG